MKPVVDFHVHVFPDNLERLIQKLGIERLPRPIAGALSADRIYNFRRRARNWMKPVITSFHGFHTNLRYLPEVFRKNLDELSGLVPLPGLFVESTHQDLKEEMKSTGVNRALVIAHPPFIPNEFVMDLQSKNPALLPVVNVPKGTLKPGILLKKYAAKGAVALKIHAAADGEGAESPRYRALLKAASDIGLPVIIHTGCLHTHLFYRSPEQGSAERFTKWYETYPDTQFILAHMNFHDPNIAFDLCEEFKNLWVDTSWQPSDVIGEAVRRIGAERILFGSDWPLVGNNMAVGKQRIQECIDIGLLNEKQAELILGENALKLLGLKMDAD